MNNQQRNPSSSKGLIYTLAQSGTHKTDTYLGGCEKLVFGEGTTRSDKKALKGRAKRKAITQALILSLIDVAKAKGENDRVQTYWNAYHCQSNLTTSNGRVFGKYCKTRFCTLCLSIRKAEIINKYLPIIKEWESPYFVTLTVRAIKAGQLPKWIKAMKVAFNRLLQRIKKRYQRGKSVKLVGVKSLECNFNPEEQTYNPHYHLIVKSKEMANILVVEWQRTWNAKQKLTSPFAQDARKINHTEKALIEIIKYGSKIFTEPDIANKLNCTVPPTMYAAALDNIFCAMKGYRLFDRFGFNLPTQTAPLTPSASFLTDYEEWIYERTANDWVSMESGELLTGFIIPNQLRYLLGSNINSELE